MKQHISEVKSQFNPAFGNKAHVQLEFFKYEIRKFTIEFSKNKAKLKREKLSEVKLTELEQNLSNDEAKEQYNAYRGEINEIYNEISNGIKIRSKCDWYKFGEKSNKFFLTMEKRRATQNTVRKMLSDEQEITDLSKINTHTYRFYQQLYMEKQNISEDSICNFLNDITIPSLTTEQSLSCEANLTEKEIYNTLISFENNKSPGNDGLTKEFYYTFWDDIKDTFMKSLKESKKLKYFCASQRQAIVKLLEKPNKDKRYISNWRPISLLNFDLKMISKSLATRVRKVLSNLVDFRQTAYVNERFIGESGCLIDYVIKVCDIQKISGYLLTVDFEKAFDSLNHKFLIAVLKQYGFGEDFIDWIKIVLRDQESCVINGGHTTTYFRLERGARQGDPISAYLFILALELFFILIKSNKNIHGINIFSHDFLYTAYADDTTFFLKDLDSVKYVLEMLNQFYMVSELPPNFSKCEIAGIGSLKDAKVALCGLKNLDLD